MPTDPRETPRFPERPNLRHLKAQAKDLLEAGAAASLTDAQFRVARLYGFSSWPKLKAHVESLKLEEMPAEGTVAGQTARDALIAAILTFLDARIC